MASVASASSSTITSILGMVATVAITTQRSVQTAASTIDMLDTYVDTARKNQLAKHKVSNELYLRNLLQESALEQAKREQNIAKQLSDSDLKTRFDTIETKLEKLFAETTA